MTIMNTCYICLEPTQEKSPCECQSFCHKHCIMNYIKETQTTTCSICKDKINGHERMFAHVVLLNKWKPNPKKCNHVDGKCAVTALIALLLYFIYLVVYLSSRSETFTLKKHYDMIMLTMMAFLPSLLFGLRWACKICHYMGVYAVWKYLKSRPQSYMQIIPEENNV